MNVNLIEAVKQFYCKYATFTGRATRAEYWWVTLAFFIFSVVMSFLGRTGEWITNIVSLASIIPMFALIVRRLHDVNLSGWWLLGYYIASIAVWVWFFVILFAHINISAVATATPDQVVSAILPLVGFLTLPILLSAILGIAGIVVMCIPSKPANKYGPNPYEAAQ